MKQNLKMPTRSEIFNHWKDYLDKEGLDWGEPVCWACREFPWGNKFDIGGELPIYEIVQNWNKINCLHRCHIIAESLGGSNTVDNLFLMCVDCHDLAPNTRSKRLFLVWAKNQKGRRMKEIEQAIKSFDLSEEECLAINEIVFGISNNDFKVWLFENTTLHRDQRGRGNRLTISTLVAASIEYCRHRLQS